MNRYKYLNKKGEHVHTLDENPLIGTSGVGSIISKPLSYWASGLAVASLGVVDPKVLTKIKRGIATEQEKKELHVSCDKFLTKLKNASTEEYIKYLDDAYRAHSKTLTSKAKEGTDLHAELEKFVRSEMKGENRAIFHYDLRIHPFYVWARKNVKKYLWSEVNCYSERLWVGGISDLGILDIHGKIGLVDFKSSKEAYLTQFWQCAGYDIQISENGGFDEEGNKIFELPAPIDYYAIVPFGAKEVKPWVNVDVKGGREAFEAEVLLYKKLPRD